MIFLSTKAKNDNRDVPDEILDADGHLQNLLRELEVTQQKYMYAMSEKDHIKMRRQSKITKGNVKGNVDNAKDQLTEFMGDSERDVKQMKTDLLET